jgi:cyclopropane fatty-acyl-phospholipid synthase-like methyltransferase
VTGVDISPEHIGQATRNVPDAEFSCSDALTVSFPVEHFDAIVSLYTFDHIPRDEHKDLLERPHAWLRPEGLLLLSIEDVDEPGTVANGWGSTRTSACSAPKQLDNSFATSGLPLTRPR